MDAKVPTEKLGGMMGENRQGAIVPRPKKEPATKSTIYWRPESLRDRMERAAEVDRRSLNEEVLIALEFFLEQREAQDKDR